jgi:Ca2+-binding EF-hand superfamily protein
MKAAVTDAAKTDRIAIDGLRRVFANIGAHDRITDDEVQLIFKELGNDSGELDIPRFKTLVCP